MRNYSDGITKTELAALCGVDKAQISRLIGELLKKEYVCTASPNKSYRQKYILTEEGKRVSAEIEKIVVDINTYVSGDIPPEELDTFYSTFEKICQRLACAEEKF